MTKRNLLVTTDLLDQRSVKRLRRYAEVFNSSKLQDSELARLLPSVDCLMIFGWPSFLTKERLGKMPRLRFIQSILAGVNHVPFGHLDKRVIVCSNAGAYSDEVAEYACGLLLSAAKRIVEQHSMIREGRGVIVRHGDAAKGITILKGKTLGILGFGAIGASVARVARAFGMSVHAFSRKRNHAPGVRMFYGKKGLNQVLRKSDAVVLALPLTRLTSAVINRQTLSMMKKNAILVNIGRGELVDEKSIFGHLRMNPNFRYGTDVWWYREGKESLTTKYPFTRLPNFVGTLHVSGPSALETGRPVILAVENMLRFLRNLRPRNVVDRSDYVSE